MQKKWGNAGFVKQGAQCNLSVMRTMKTALARRIALSAAIRERLREARERLQRARGGRPATDEIADIESRLRIWRGAWRACRFSTSWTCATATAWRVPAPVARAVMFCLMDVSASMDEDKKDLAKRFFTLLYLFLTRKYEQVELVFIRHTDDAEEVDEDTFFHDTQSGGTVVYSALELMQQICAARYPRSDWNIYAAQASDGDAFGADAGKSARFLREQNLLPLTRYFAYIECPDENQSGNSSLWVEYEELQRLDHDFAMRRVYSPAEIYPVFRDLFRKETA